MHKLWAQAEEQMGNGWKLFEAAADEEVIAALMDPPPFGSSEIYGYLRRSRGRCIQQYQQLFYGGQTPESIASVRRKATGF